LRLWVDTCAAARFMMPVLVDLNVWRERTALYTPHPNNRVDVTSWLVLKVASQ